MDKNEPVVLLFLKNSGVISDKNTAENNPTNIINPEVKTRWPAKRCDKEPRIATSLSVSVRLQVLFSNTEEILAVHRDFLSMAEDLLQPDPHAHHEVGRCFLQFVSLNWGSLPSRN